MFSTLLLASRVPMIPQPEPMTTLLERTRAKYGLPSICAGAIVEGKIVSLDAVGVRRLGSDEKATVDDPYHCGSITKSFTAALFARFVEQGQVAWDAPLESLLPGLAQSMDPAYRKVTPLALLAHRSGLGAESWPSGDVKALMAWNGQPPSPREEYARRMLASPPRAATQKGFTYSNANYVVLAAILERRTGKAWESLLRERLLDPLGLKSAGYGAVAQKGAPPGPWGHLFQKGKYVPVPPGPGADNPETLGPSATLHMSVPDLLKWCAFQADEGRDGGPLKPSSFSVLHTAPFGGDYGGGLIVTSRAWAGGTCFNHAGSNTLNYENMWIVPQKRFGLVVAINAYSPDVQAAAEEIATALILRYCPK